MVKQLYPIESPLSDPSASGGLTIYCNGVFIEGQAYFCPYKNDRVLMLPLIAIATAFDYKTTCPADMTYATMYKRDVFEPNLLIIRLAQKVNKDTTKDLTEREIKCFYYSKGDAFLPVEKSPEVRSGLIYVPVGYIKLAFSCTAEISESGNILLTT